MKKTPINRKIFCAHGFKELTLLKMSILSKAIHRFKEISVRVPRAFSHKNIPNDLKICIGPRKIPNSQSTLEKQNWRHYISSFQTILQSYSNQNCYRFVIEKIGT